MLAFGIHSLSEGDIHYIPFSLFEEDKIIANVSVGKLHIVIEGKKLATHIIQTVATLPEYRKRGLVKHIFTYVDPFLALHADKSFLLASKSLKEFYAQFAYQTTEMASHFIALPPKVKLKRNKLLHVDIKRH